jgi:hypothetical protein
LGSPLLFVLESSVLVSAVKMSTLFSGFKTSMREDLVYNTGGEWLRDRGKHDGVDPNLWRVHNSLYDLSKFVAKVPPSSLLPPPPSPSLLPPLSSSSSTVIISPLSHSPSLSLSFHFCLCSTQEGQTG